MQMIDLCDPSLIGQFLLKAGRLFHDKARSPDHLARIGIEKMRLAIGRRERDLVAGLQPQVGRDARDDGRIREREMDQRVGAERFDQFDSYGKRILIALDDSEMLWPYS